LPPVEQPVTCSRCGFSWDWHANAIARCPKCAMPLDVASIKAAFNINKGATTLTPNSIEEFQRDMHGKVGELIRRRK